MAGQLFKRYSGGKTLHQLRHSRLTHLGDQNVSAPLLMAISGHKRSLDHENPRSGKPRELERSSRLGLTCVDAAFFRSGPRVKRGVATLSGDHRSGSRCPPRPSKPRHRNANAGQRQHVRKQHNRAGNPSTGTVTWYWRRPGVPAIRTSDPNVKIGLTETPMPKRAATYALRPPVTRRFVVGVEPAASSSRVKSWKAGGRCTGRLASCVPAATVSPYPWP